MSVVLPHHPFVGQRNDYNPVPTRVGWVDRGNRAVDAAKCYTLRFVVVFSHGMGIHRTGKDPYRQQGAGTTRDTLWAIYPVEKRIDAGREK